MRPRSCFVARLKPGVSLEQGCRASAQFLTRGNARSRDKPRSHPTAVSMRAARRKWLGLLDAAGAWVPRFWLHAPTLQSVPRTSAGRERELAVRARWRERMASLIPRSPREFRGCGGGLAASCSPAGPRSRQSTAPAVYSEAAPLTLGPVVLGVGFALALSSRSSSACSRASSARMDLQQSLREGAATTTTANRTGRLRRVSWSPKLPLHSCY